MRIVIQVYLFIAILLLIPSSSPKLMRKSRKGAHKHIGKTRSRRGLNITNSEIEDAIDFVKSYKGYLQRLENTIREPSRIIPHSPTHGSFMMLEPDFEAIKRGREARIAVRASAQLAYSYCSDFGIDLNKCNNVLDGLNFMNTSLRSSCSYANRSCTHEEQFNAYRSVDGTCNHVHEKSLGESYTAYRRMLRPQYLNFFGTPKRSFNKRELPSARSISSAVVKHQEVHHGYLTTAFSQWGQFIEYDLSRFGSSVMFHHNESFRCCGTNGFHLAPRYTHPLCMPISVSSADRYYKKKHVECMSYTRSLLAIDPHCKFGSLEQQNQATHYLDGSQIYGSSANKSSKLRRSRKGKLRASHLNRRDYLPHSLNPQQHCFVKSPNDTCYTSGDDRVNFFPQVAVMHTLWLREHNRIAKELARMNKEWDSETLFQETRRIVVAEMQHITYHEWLRHLLDDKYLTKIHSFDESMNPSISNEFAVAAIKSIYSMIPNTMSLVNSHRQVVESQRLVNHFMKPKILTIHLTSLVRGLANQRSQKLGIHFAEDLTNHLFADKHYGYDLFSLDIQRGRDHGLPGYNHYRHLCGLKKATNIVRLLDWIPKAEMRVLANTYHHVDDIDLIVGGLMERPVRKSLLGPTFSCIIGEQFVRTKRGDRYFYTNPKQPKPFTKLQLDEIRKVTLARIFCDNSNVGTIQRHVFERVSKSNYRVDCLDKSIHKLNLTPWHHDREKYVV